MQFITTSQAIHPVITLANYHQFRPAATIHFPCVQSRMLLWCKQGKGQVTVNGTQHSMTPGDLLILPWKHRINYLADSKSPFLVGGVHLIPNHDLAMPVELVVAHHPEDPLADAWWRRDAPIAGLDEVVVDSVQTLGRLGLLLEYLVGWFQETPRSPEKARQLGAVLLDELCCVGQQVPSANALPENVQSLISWVEQHLAQEHQLAELAHQAACSVSTLTRLCKRHLQMTPMQWVNHLRIKQAAQTLATTRMPIAEIGRSVGISDPYYFSKLFKSQMGVSPSAYRASSSLFSK